MDFKEVGGNFIALACWVWHAYASWTAFFAIRAVVVAVAVTRETVVGKTAEITLFSKGCGATSNRNGARLSAYFT